MKCFPRFSIAIFRPKLKNNHQKISIHGSCQQVATNLKGCFKKFNFIFILQPILADSFYKRSPCRLHHKIDPKKTLMHKSMCGESEGPQRQQYLSHIPHNIIMILDFCNLTSFYFLATTIIFSFFFWFQTKYLVSLFQS